MNATAKIYMNDFGRISFQKIWSFDLSYVRTRVYCDIWKFKWHDDINNYNVSFWIWTCESTNNLLLKVIEKLILFQTEHLFKQIKDSGIPLLFVFSENDAVVNKNEFFEFSKLLGANQMNTCLYDKEGNLIKPGKLK